MPSNRVSKSSASNRSSSLLAVILNSPSSIVMPSCLQCTRRGIPSCRVSSTDSTRCSECVRYNRSNCDVQGLSNAQLLRIGAQHRKVEEEMEQAEEELRVHLAKLDRLRKQKKMWLEKMLRAVARGIDDVGELERLEEEERLAEERRVAALAPSPAPDEIPLDFAWDSFDAGALLQLSETGDTGQQAAGSSQGASQVPTYSRYGRIPSI